MGITEGFRKGDNVGRGQGQRSDLGEGGELLRSSGGKDGDGGFQGLGKGASRMRRSCPSSSSS